MTKIETIRNEVSDILKANFPEFEYKGHGANIGVWETEDFQSLTKPFGDSFWSGRFRIWVFVPNQQGQQIKIEVFLISVYEWETAFEGYIKDFNDLPEMLRYQFGLPKKDEK